MWPTSEEHKYIRYIPDSIKKSRLILYEQGLIYGFDYVVVVAKDNLQQFDNFEKNLIFWEKYMLQIILNFIKRQESNKNSLNIFFSRLMGKCFIFRSKLEFFTPIDVKRFLAAKVDFKEVEKI